MRVCVRVCVGWTYSRTVAVEEEVKADEPVAVAPDPVAPEPVEEATMWTLLPQEDTPVVVTAVTVEDDDPFKDMKPGCTKVDTPLPMLILEPQAVGPSSWEQELCEIKDSGPLQSVPSPLAQTLVQEESTVWEPLSPNNTRSDSPARLKKTSSLSQLAGHQTGTTVEILTRGLFASFIRFEFQHI